MSSSCGCPEKWYVVDDDGNQECTTCGYIQYTISISPIAMIGEQPPVEHEPTPAPQSLVKEFDPEVEAIIAEAKDKDLLGKIMEEIITKANEASPSQPLVMEHDPELEALLAEEEHIQELAAKASANENIHEEAAFVSMNEAPPPGLEYTPELGDLYLHKSNAVVCITSDKLEADTPSEIPMYKAVIVYPSSPNHWSPGELYIAPDVLDKFYKRITREDIEVSPKDTAGSNLILWI